MKALTTMLAAGCVVLSACRPTNEQRGTADTLLQLVNRTASSDFAAACISLARDVQDKRLTVYAVVPKSTIITNEAGYRTKTAVTEEAGITIQVIYHRELANNYAVREGSYQQHYNSCLLDFALAQYAEGKKALGVRLVQLLAEAEPDLSWSSSEIGPVTVQKILAGLKADDSSLSSVLKEATRDWHQRESDYKP